MGFQLGNKRYVVVINSKALFIVGVNKSELVC